MELNGHSNVQYAAERLRIVKFYRHIVSSAKPAK